MHKREFQGVSDAPRWQTAALVAAQTIRRLDPDFSGDSPVAVALVPCDLHLRAEDQTGKAFLGALAEGLRILRSIDSGDADLVLLATSRSFHQYRYKHKPFIAHFDGEETVIDIEMTELYFAAQELLQRYRSAWAMEQH